MRVCLWHLPYHILHTSEAKQARSHEEYCTYATAQHRIFAALEPPQKHGSAKPAFQIHMLGVGITALMPFMLQGVGPATASAMLTVFTPSLPFMSDEALAAALPGRPEYTVKQYIQLVEALRNKADALSCASGGFLNTCR